MQMQELTMDDILKATKSEPVPGLFPASGHRYARCWVTGTKDGVVRFSEGDDDTSFMKADVFLSLARRNPFAEG